MATKKTAASAATNAALHADATDAVSAAPAAEKMFTVVAAKAFLGPDGWVQPGDETEVTAARKRDLARNGLLQGEDGENEDVRPLGEPRDTTRKLHVSGSAGDQTEDNT